MDSSALVKLVVEEAESAALEATLPADTAMASSALARVEVVRAVRPLGREAVERAGRLLDRVDLLEVDDATLQAAGRTDPPVLRTLDAIHLASAQALGPALSALVTYDRRLADAARAAGIPVEAPA